LSILSGALFAIVGVIALRVSGGTASSGVDRAISRVVVGSARLGKAGFRTDGALPWPNGAMRQLVLYGLPAAAVTIALGLALVAWWRRDVRVIALCLVGPALAVVTTHAVLKPIVDRHQGDGLAYPSAHATGAAAVAALVVILVYRWAGPRAAGWSAPFALALPAAMGVALIRLGWHYPTDVVGGNAMGAATVIALAVALRAHQLSPIGSAGHADRRRDAVGRPGAVLLDGPTPDQPLGPAVHGREQLSVANTPDGRRHRRDVLGRGD